MDIAVTKERASCALCGWSSCDGSSSTSLIVEVSSAHCRLHKQANFLLGLPVQHKVFDVLPEDVLRAAHLSLRPKKRPDMNFAEPRSACGEVAKASDDDRQCCGTVSARPLVPPLLASCAVSIKFCQSYLVIAVWSCQLVPQPMPASRKTMGRPGNERAPAFPEPALNVKHERKSATADSLVARDAYERIEIAPTMMEGNEGFGQAMSGEWRCCSDFLCVLTVVLKISYSLFFSKKMIRCSRELTWHQRRRQHQCQRSILYRAYGEGVVLEDVSKMPWPALSPGMTRTRFYRDWRRKLQTSRTVCSIAEGMKMLGKSHQSSIQSSTSKTCRRMIQSHLRQEA